MANRSMANRLRQGSFRARVKGKGTPFSGACGNTATLTPPPSPDEVYRYFQTLPLPQLATRQQPPGNGLVGLPVIFWTDSPTTQTFTVNIRGFQVVIAAT